jgi:hypothetical protein
MALADDIDLALTDAFSVTATKFTWNGQQFGCVLNADQNVLVTSKVLFGTNLPRIGDVINLAGKDRQITGRANSAEEFVPGGLSAENTFVDDPANPSLAIQFSSFIGK